MSRRARRHDAQGVTTTGVPEARVFQERRTAATVGDDIAQPYGGAMPAASVKGAVDAG
jgi:hypothetical protein